MKKCLNYFKFLWKIFKRRAETDILALSSLVARCRCCPVSFYSQLYYLFFALGFMWNYLLLACYVCSISLELKFRRDFSWYISGLVLWYYEPRLFIYLQTLNGNSFALQNLGYCQWKLSWSSKQNVYLLFVEFQVLKEIIYWPTWNVLLLAISLKYKTKYLGWRGSFTRYHRTNCWRTFATRYTFY